MESLDASNTALLDGLTKLNALAGRASTFVSEDRSRVPQEQVDAIANKIVSTIQNEKLRAAVAQYVAQSSPDQRRELVFGSGDFSLKQGKRIFPSRDYSDKPIREKWSRFCEVNYYVVCDLFTDNGDAMCREIARNICYTELVP